MTSDAALSILSAAVSDLKLRRLNDDLPLDPDLDYALMKVKIEVMAAQIYRETIEAKLRELGERWVKG